MKTVAEIIKELSAYPPNALAYAYEGEVTGIVIVQQGTAKQLGYVEARDAP